MDSTHVFFNFGHLELMDSYAVVTCNEGVHIEYKEVAMVRGVFDEAYSGKNFGLIAYRMNSYSVNPLAIKDLFSCDNLLAGVIVGHGKLVESTAKYESMIITGAPIKHFREMDSGVKWIEDTLRQYCDAEQAPLPINTF